MYQKVEICGIKTADLKVLKEAEKIELFKQMRDGSKTAREKLINGNLKLVLSVIQRFSERGECMDDLFQVGCIGLMKAIDNFNIDLNFKFSTYAVSMIIGEIRRFLRDNNPIRVSRSIRDTAYKAMQAKEALLKEKNREPTVEEIARYMHIKKEEVVIALEAIVEPISIYEPVYSEGGDTIYVCDQIGDKNTDASWVNVLNVKEQLKSLPKREKDIIHMRYILGKTQTEVAEEIGISQAQVSRLEKNALKRIKE
ncbi:MAG: RNA polymerase sporulation sigma factor SigG [Clostridia bacterium]|nr:RNA polymerase sporulation sigma factor SigG [Clostridia bacterium]